ncbi:hypothetical protein DPX16_6765 [Anabarilius grahami]|uniref:Uncharacterized protein n=1 Tax=Anabarilius grahami TaxID=495550 RepID=A0A3N0Y5D5_ANAGA|nr:hypothetical protein DPX16_6765 [Anabarilius grahami]
MDSVHIVACSDQHWPCWDKNGSSECQPWIASSHSASLWTDPQPADKTLSPITKDCSGHVSAAERPPQATPASRPKRKQEDKKRKDDTDIKALPLASSNPIRGL